MGMVFDGTKSTVLNLVNLCLMHTFYFNFIFKEIKLKSVASLDFFGKNLSNELSIFNFHHESAVFHVEHELARIFSHLFFQYLFLFS
jgi:hypothetical protein